MPVPVLVIVCHIFAKAENVDHVKNILTALIEPTKKEEGCIRIRLLEDIADKTHFTFISQWESDEVYENYLQALYIAKAGEDLKNELAEVADVKKYKYIQHPEKKEEAKNSSGRCTLL
ncbi:unnamed protein product [Didymodactylos carnosus]|uniref:ABM domain-containing protein n=1 Tax=Didymodactylos carnosus TaxID=1234261 RepID=A0A815KTJ9_9BILA|nr:unnamed protein product [Didymodactylos carnosus]CAF1399623.1 unnamed protein product [Didymodactylos carnosus]CAF4207001.1 unnamed protein product [Didymodactylos carnosus]CAF4292121.1 unnamed protein product [Didymodactylos carnosus]